MSVHRKKVREMVESAEKIFDLKTNVVDLASYKDAPNSPYVRARGTFCIIFNREIVAHHPISKTRFKNILNKIQGPKNKRY